MSYALGQTAPPPSAPASTPGTVTLNSGATVHTDNIKTVALVAGGVLLFLFLIKELGPKRRRGASKSADADAWPDQKSVEKLLHADLSVLVVGLTRRSWRAGGIHAAEAGYGVLGERRDRDRDRRSEREGNDW